MKSYSEIVEAWGRNTMASDLDVPPERVRGWQRFNTIPVGHWKRLIELGPVRGIEVSADLLIRIAAEN